MADDTQVSVEVPVTKTVDEAEPKIDAIKVRVFLCMFQMPEQIHQLSCLGERILMKNDF